MFKRQALILRISNFIYVFIAVLFFADAMTQFDIKSQTIKSIVYYGFLFLSPGVLFLNLILLEQKTKILRALFPIAMIISIFWIGPLKIGFSSGAWRTQSVLYQNAHFNFKKIELQMQDVGALGYNRRVVEVIYLTDLFMITKKVDTSIPLKIEWQKIEKEANELKL